MGNADRACYDLSQHMKATGQRLVAERILSKPKEVDVVECQPNKGAIGKVYKKLGSVLINHLEQLTETECDKLENDLNADR